MSRTNGKIGFDDRLVIVILVPLLSLMIPLVFFGMHFQRAPLFTWNVYLTTVVITAFLWLGNRYIMIWARKRYPQFEDVKQRLLVQSIIMIVYTLVANNALGYFVDEILRVKNVNNFPSDTYIDVMIKGNYASLFCTITIVAIYESIYFMHELKKSVEEKEMHKRESLQAQLNALKTQVNPHFLFNNLNTLCSIIPEHPDQAVDFVQQLSKVYRHILEVKDEQSISLKEELDVLRAYAFLLKTRFGDNLDIRINVPDQKLSKQIVPLSLQILMENAIKHNVVSADKPLKIDVFSQNGKLVVSNNLQRKNQANESTGIGLDNLRNRYKLLGNKQVEVSASGASFVVSIPLLES